MMNTIIIVIIPFQSNNYLLRCLSFSPLIGQRFNAKRFTRSLGSINITLVFIL